MAGMCGPLGSGNAMYHLKYFNFFWILLSKYFSVPTPCHRVYYLMATSTHSVHLDTVSILVVINLHLLPWCGYLQSGTDEICRKKLRLLTQWWNARELERHFLSAVKIYCVLFSSVIEGGTG